MTRRWWDHETSNDNIAFHKVSRKECRWRYRVQKKKKTITRFGYTSNPIQHQMPRENNKNLLVQVSIQLKQQQLQNYAERMAF